MNGPIRGINLAGQLLRDVAPPDGFWTNLYFEGDPAHTPHAGKVIPPLHNGTVMEDMVQVRTGRDSALRFGSPILYSQFGIWAQHAIGPSIDTPGPGSASDHVAGFATVTTPGTGYTTAPTVTPTGGTPSRPATFLAVVSGGAVIGVYTIDPGAGYSSAPTLGFSGGAGSGAAATITLANVSSAHVLKAGPAVGLPLAALRVYDNVEWEQHLNHQVNTARLNLAANGIPRADLDWMGTFAQNIAAPTAVPVPLFPFREPADNFQQIINVNGVNAKLITGSLNIRNGLTAFWDGEPNADIAYLDRGGMGVDIDITCDIQGRTGSLYEAALSGVNPGALQCLWMDTNTILGTVSQLGTVTLTNPVIVPGYQTVTLTGTITTVVPGSRLTFDTGASLETVTVYAKSGQTVTAVFNKLHSAGVAVLFASTNIYPYLQIDVFNPLLRDPNKTNHNAQRAQHIVGNAGYDRGAGTVLQALILDTNSWFPVM